jgi:hypothetical protein
MDMRFDIRNTGSLCRAGSLVTASKELSKYVDNIKMDLGEIRWGGVDFIGLAQDKGKWRGL